jgi:hypothetical protein
LISPAISATSLILTFDNVKNFVGDDLKLMVSENYTGNVAAATWNQLNYVASTGNYNWAKSGEIKYNPQGGKVHIAFKYVSTTSDGALWRVDNIVVKSGGGQNIDENPKIEVSIYPNPTDGLLWVDCRDALQSISTEIEIFDIFGRRVDVAHPPLQGGLRKLDISHLPASIYFVRMTTETGVITKKIVKK